MVTKKNIVVKLLPCGHDTHYGVTLSDDIHFGQHGLMNISRPQHIIQSQYFEDVDIGIHIVTARSIVVKLLLSDHDTPDGITLSADMPFGQQGLMNISRPAVLRTYYGLNIEPINPTKWKRVTYGPTGIMGPLSMDPRDYCTKSMPSEMFELGVHLKNYVKKIIS